MLSEQFGFLETSEQPNFCECDYTFNNPVSKTGRSLNSVQTNPDFTLSQNFRFLDKLSEQLPPWLSEKPDQDGIILSTRIRLARNLKGFPFPPNASKTQAKAVLDQFEAARRSVSLFKRAIPLRVDKTDANLVEILNERHLISAQFVKSTLPRLALIEPSEQFCVMVNEEDHLRIQSIRAGLDFESAWRHVSWIDDEISERLPFAWSPRFGYQTACPTNTGTGLRASIQIHLPGLVLSNAIQKMTKKYPEYQTAFRGISGEGSETLGNIFQISNQRTLGRTEGAILNRLNEAARDFVAREREARRFLFDAKRDFMFDKVFRALAILQNARLLKTEEFCDCLSMARLGLDSGMIQGADQVLLNRLMILSRDAHLRKKHGAHNEDEKRIDGLRAELCRGGFAKAVCREK